MPKIAIYINPFDPPTMHHRTIAERLCAEFDRVVVIPSGKRRIIAQIPDSRPIHRATMADLNFRGLDNLVVDLHDLEHAQFTPPVEQARRWAMPNEEAWFVVTAEMVRGGGAGQSTIQREWPDGEIVWGNAGFAVLTEKNQPIDPADLPRHSTVIVHPPHIPSSSVRMMLTQGEPIRGQLYEPVEAYIRRHGLFRDVPLMETITARPTQPLFKLHIDESNPRSHELAEQLRAYESERPRMIVSLGGDGTMLRAIRQHWRERLPFIGINSGGLGFLLSGRELTSFWEQELLLYHLPLLRVVAEFDSGEPAEAIAFNDAWVERATGQTAWVRVLVNGVVRVPRLVADGVLVATAAGSSSYARAMGATPVPLNTQVLMLVGSNVLKPTFWRPVVLPIDSEIVLESVDPERRPLKGFIDGEAYPRPIRRMSIRVSRTAAAELAFTRDQDPVAKLGFMQFPREND